MKKKDIKKYAILGIIALAFMGVAVFLIARGSLERKALREEQNEKVFQISREDADSLIAEKIAASGLAYEFKSILELEGGTNYLYRVFAKEEDEGELLAVNTVSGEVNVYLPKENAFAPYSSFSGYDETADENIEWNGEYASEKYVISIEEQDPSSFEYRISPLQGEGAELHEFAAKENNVSAKGEIDGAGVSFDLKGRRLTFTAEGTASGYSGVYTRR